jgi:hypothetical protein
VRVSAHFEGVNECLADLLAGLDGGLSETMHTVDVIVADEAAARHPYQNRTWNLQRHTVPGRVTGSVRTNFHGAVHGDMFYGSFVDEGTSRSRPYPFLFPAYVRAEPAVSASMDRGLMLSVQRGGWAP